jgi:glycosyltransferase involved in cell wall biosynthesis
MLSSLGMDVPAAERSVSAVVPTNREHEIDNILANVGWQSHRDLELVLVLHGLKVDHADLKSRSKDFGVGHLVVIDAGEGLTLGACMNLGVDAASGAYIAKMDDDNFYGRHYLQDLLSAFDYTEAGIVGKWAHYVWLQASGAVVLRYSASEHTYERRIQGGSMLCHQDVVRNLRFSDLPRAIDSDILDRAAAAGVKIYSADRFNFVSIRGADRHAHTWTVADSTFMTSTGQLLFYGDPRPHVEI